MARRVKVARKTKETNLTVQLGLDGPARAKVRTGVAFLDHMLTLVGVHGGFDLAIRGTGDLEIDHHHTNEDVGIVLGQAFDRALGNRRGIHRYGWAYVPMEEALARIVLDFSGRPKLVVRDQRPPAVQKRPTGSHGPYQWGDAEHFLEAFTRASKTTIHVDILAGSDFHHTCEAVFKALGRALRQATSRDANMKGVPSTKGTL